MKQLTCTLGVFLAITCSQQILAQTTQSKSQSLTLAEVQQSIISQEKGCRKASVGLKEDGLGDGSGVIVSKDGIILTAAHVASRVGAELDVFLSNGRRAKATVILHNKKADAAICKITTSAPLQGWPFRPITTEKAPSLGDWLFIISNGGGIQLDRPAPLKIGRLLRSEPNPEKHQYTTDCSAVSGDSGGPLYDLKGNVVAVTSNVKPSDILQNSHISTETFKSLWGEFLDGSTPLPTAKETTQFITDRRLAMGVRSSVIDSKTRRRVTKILKNYFKDMPKEAVELIVNDTDYVNKKVKVRISTYTYKKLTKLGIDPTKYKLKEPKISTEPARMDAWIRSTFGTLNPKVHAYLFKTLKVDDHLGLNLELKQQDLKFLKKYSFNHVDAAIAQALNMRFSHFPRETRNLLKETLHWTPKGLKLKTTLEQGDILALSGIAPERPDSLPREQVDQILEARFKRLYGANLNPEALKLLINGVTKYGAHTGAWNRHFPGEVVAKIRELGVPLGMNKPTPLSVAAKKHGDSSDEVLKQLPPLSKPIKLFQSGEALGLATPVSKDGELLTKHSLIYHNYNLTVEIDGKQLPAKLLASDQHSDLALLKVEATFDLPEWSANELALGSLYVAVTNNGNKLAVNSVKQRTIPAQPTDIFGQTKDKKGKPVDSFAQFISKQSGQLSWRRKSLPKSISHDAVMLADDCGGPLYTIDGKLAGINIARYGRTTNYAYPKETIDEALAQLRTKAKTPLFSFNTSKEKTHIFYLLGGSSMSGWEEANEEDKKTVDGIYFIPKVSLVNWQPAAHPLHQNSNKEFFGPGMAFAKAYKAANPDVTVCIIPLAGAANQLSSYETETTDYWHFKVRAEFSPNFGVAKGIIYQTSHYDFNTVKKAQLFEKKLNDLFSRTRKQLNAPQLPIVVGEFPKQFDNHKAAKPEATAIARKVLKELAAKNDNVLVVDSKGLTSPEKKPRHFDRASTIELGKRYAEALKKTP